MTKSRTFCVLPWTHLSMESANLEYKMCCVTDDIIPGGFSASKCAPEDALGSVAMDEVRKAMMTGKEVEACRVCYEEEKASTRSMRTFYLESGPDRESELVGLVDEEGRFHRPPGIEHLEVRLGNLCNLKCVMCSPLNSSAYDDYEEIFGRAVKDRTPVQEINKTQLERIFPTLRNVRQLTFRGGEPLINRRHEELLEYLVATGRSSEVQLTYTTNGTHLPKRLKKDWQKFKRVHLWVSVDGVGESNEFIRYPSRWDQIEKNLGEIDQWAAEIPQLCWGITTTAQAYNLHQLAELCRLTARFRYCSPLPFLNRLHFPEALKVESLTREKIQEALPEIRLAMNESGKFRGADPVERGLMKLKGMEEHRRKNTSALNSFLAYLETLPGAEKETSRALQELTERIIRTRKLSNYTFLKKVF